MNRINLLEAEARIKIKNCSSASDSDLVVNMIKTKLVEFCKNSSAIAENSNQNDVNTIVLEKILKAETIIAGDDFGDLSYFKIEADDLYNNDNTDTEADRNFDEDSTSNPDRDPFADIDIDPSFSRRPPSYNSSRDSCSGTQVTIINAGHDVNPSSNLSSSVKRVSPRRSTHTSKQNLERLTLYDNRKVIKTTKSGRHPLKCQLCPSSFIRHESLMAHSITHHSSNTADEDGDGDSSKLKPFKCLQCTRAFANLKGLKRHVKQRHMSERPIKCPIPNCDKAFKMKSNLKDHLRRVHWDERPFQCQEPNCGKAFKMNDQFQRHLASHATETPFKCSHADCPKAFPNAQRLKAHLKIHRGSRHLKQIKIRPFKCDQCDWAFCKNWILTEHLKTHSRDVNDFFKCPEPNCEKTFKYQSSIKVHLANYHTTNQRIFACSEPSCDKKFKTEKYAKKHSRIHTRPHKCKEPGCFKAFTRPSILNSHLESKHAKITGQIKRQKE